MKQGLFFNFYFHLDDSETNSETGCNVTLDVTKDNSSTVTNPGTLPSSIIVYNEHFNTYLFTFSFIYNKCDFYIKYHAVWKPFDPCFIVRKKSLYRNAWTFCGELSQYRALYMVADDYEKHVYDVDDAEKQILLWNNPLRMDNVFLEKIEKMGQD